MFLYGATKHSKHFEKMAELTYAELAQGRESTRLSHTHKFTSLKNVVIKNVSSQSLGLDLVNINVYAKVYQNIPLSSRD